MIDLAERWGGSSTPRTDPRLLALLERSATYKMTPQERFAQRVSFVYGQMNGLVSKDRVREILEGQ